MDASLKLQSVDRGSSEFDHFQKFRTEVTHRVDDLQRHYTATVQLLKTENDELKDRLRSAYTEKAPTKLAECNGVPDSGLDSSPRTPTLWTPRSPRSSANLLTTPRFSAPCPPKFQDCPSELLGGVSFSNVDESPDETSGAVHHWELLYIGVKELESQPKEKRRNQAMTYEMRPLWITTSYSGKNHQKHNKKNSVGWSGAPSSMSGIKADLFNHTVMGSMVSDDSIFSKLVRHPDSQWTLLHSLITSLLITIDVVVFPFSMAFLDDPPAGLTMFNLGTTIFWTMDIFLSFFTGFHTMGVIEMRPRHTAFHYLSHWFIPDIAIVCVDWVSFILSSLSGSPSSGETGILRMGKPIKMVRFLRTARILRLMKTAELMHYVLDHMAPQEWMLVIARLFGLVLFVLLICHYVACIWYIIGKDSGGLSWIISQGLENEPTFHIYVSALHWAITQFTPATNNIAPTSAAERLYATIVVVFALVMFSNFVSSLTNMTAQLRHLHAARSNEEVQIRDFFHQKQVSIELGARIWHFYRKHYRKRRKTASSIEIGFFNTMPMSLRVQLHWNIFLPTLISHPVLDHAETIDPHAMMWLCSAGLEDRTVVIGQELFMDGQTATHIVAMVSGKLLYECDFYFSPVEVGVPRFIAEAALWCKWVHCGRLSDECNVSCEVLLLGVAQLEACIAKHASEKLLRFLRQYACRFMQVLSDEFDMVGIRSTVSGLESTTTSEGCGGPRQFDFEDSSLITDISDPERIMDALTTAAHDNLNPPPGVVKQRTAKSVWGTGSSWSQNRNRKTRMRESFVSAAIQRKNNSSVQPDHTNDLTTSWLQFAQLAGRVLNVKKRPQRESTISAQSAKRNDSYDS